MNGNQITSLEHFPNIVGGGFYLGNNPIQSLTGFKTELGGELSHIFDFFVGLELLFPNVEFNFS